MHIIFYPAAPSTPGAIVLLALVLATGCLATASALSPQCAVGSTEAFPFQVRMPPVTVNASLHAHTVVTWPQWRAAQSLIT